MDINIFKIAAILGLICITYAITLTKPSKKKRQFIIYILGGILLEIYSIYIQDTIFIILQAVFILSAIIELALLYKRAQSLEKTIKDYLSDLEKVMLPGNSKIKANKKK